jgi:alkylation response protein AidB-like acyl-CoA dehydrogenase
MAGGGAVEVEVEVARRVAEEVLFPAAPAVDRADAVPVAHLDALAEAGLYGVAGPVEAGGAELGLPAFCAVVEALAGGCLTTAFVWVQDHTTDWSGNWPARALRRTCGSGGWRRCAEASCGPGSRWPGCCPALPGCGPGRPRAGGCWTGPPHG